MFQLLGSVIVIIIVIVGRLALALVRAIARAPAPAAASPIRGGDEKQDEVYRKYRELRAPRVGKAAVYEEYCWPQDFALQRQQLFGAEYMDLEPGCTPNGCTPKGCTPNGCTPKELLVFHRIGAGKSCFAIQVGMRYRGAKSGARPLFVMPASLIPGFRNELRGPCGGGDYMTEAERATQARLTPGEPEYRALLERSDARIDADFQILSYNKFAEDAKNAAAPLIVIDEVQNINNPDGVYYKAALAWIDGHPKASVVVMSGTPVFDSAEELDSLAPLLRIEVPPGGFASPDGISDPESAASVEKAVARHFAGKVSYYGGAPPSTFPATTIRVRRCRMSRHQAHWYRSEAKAEMTKSGGIALKHAPNDFYINSRQRSNIVYPKGLTGEAGLAALTPALIRESLETYSAKFARLVRRLRRGELSFVYSSFTGPGGIGALTKCLDALGWRDFAAHGPGRRRYAVWSGDETGREKDLIRATFNAPQNDGGAAIQAIIGSPSIKEGVTLLRVRVVHVLEAYWNHSRLAQIFGRAVRYCSHRSLPSDERAVAIYVYAAVCGSSADANDATPERSVDLYMLGLADAKRAAAAPAVRALINVAVDRYLYYGKKGEAAGPSDGLSLK